MADKMLWRVRATLPDRPGTLAALAQRCGEAGVNILGMQIFPELDQVTDEFVVSTPRGWGEAEINDLVVASGGGSTVVQVAHEASLADQPTRYVQAACHILERPMSFHEIVARLFDAEAEAPPGVVHDTMELRVADVDVQLHRTAPFTETEHARGAAMASLVNDRLDRGREWAAIGTAPPVRRLGTGSSPELVATGETVTALVDGIAVGIGQVHAPTAEDENVRVIDLRVDPAWQRRGIGTKLLVDTAKLAHMLGAAEILITTESDNQAVLPMVLAAGMRGRIRMAGDLLTVKVPVRDLKPLDG
ncbi:ACT domain-containing protein [Nocardioides albertanoniae]|uniref:ACT domain-containing protein n=1 Tax=Nocardioides albertanoniae TaxID=1175486 RepID=A0A543ACC3_9ACTN|nr:GNAT family N-acetyltransferase [Nocardioides albertanoniae]TQL70233.1 ACT domain-containing protein [Nocardioides albertanoniae]